MSGALARPGRRARGSSAGELRLASSESAVTGVCRPRVEAVALLAQVMARLHGLEMPVVQFVQALPSDIDVNVARSFAEASLVRLGRTLLVNAHGFESGPIENSANTSLARAVTRRRTRKAGSDWPDAVPDSLYAGLYHAHIRHEVDDAAHFANGAPGFWLGGAKRDFRLLVIDSGPIEQCPSTISLAASCHGSIVNVAAGRTTLSHVQNAIRQVQLAGGTVLGTVLYDSIPAQHESFLRRSQRHGHQLASD